MPNLFYPGGAAMPANIQFIDAGAGAQGQIIPKFSDMPGIQGGMCLIMSIKWLTYSILHMTPAGSTAGVVTPITILQEFDAYSGPQWDDGGMVLYRGFANEYTQYGLGTFDINTPNLGIHLQNYIQIASGNSLTSSFSQFYPTADSVCVNLDLQLSYPSVRGSLFLTFSENSGHATALIRDANGTYYYDCNQGIFNMDMNTRTTSLTDIIRRHWAFYGVKKAYLCVF